jgi:outer membrane biosynthesis protein TonB
MLNQLIESKSNSSENNSRAGFLVSTAAFVALFACCALTWSLFAKDVVSASDSLEMSSLLPPVAIAETVPPKPELIIKKEVSEKQSQSTEIKVAVRQTLIARIDENQSIPDKISTVQNTSKSRPNGAVIIKNGVESDAMNSTIGNERKGGDDTSEVKTPTRVIKKIVPVEETKDDPPPTVKKVVVAEVKPKDPVKKDVSLGVINGKASNLPKPAFTAAAKAVGANGAVSVQVSIDENGNVTSVKAVSGHPLLRAASENAAKNAKFTQTFLSGQPVKVTGVIIYNFVK